MKGLLNIDCIGVNSICLYTMYVHENFLLLRISGVGPHPVKTRLNSKPCERTNSITGGEKGQALATLVKSLKNQQPV